VRILQVTPSYYPAVGGVERHVQAISERLVHLGHEVTVLTMGSGASAPRRDVIDGVTIHRFPSVGIGNVYRVPVGLLPYLWRARASFDIVHVHNYHAILMPLVVATRPSCLVVTPHLNDRAHSSLAQVLHYPYALIGRRCLKHAHAVVCVSAAERSRLMSRLRVPSDRISVIPNGIDSARIRSAETSTLKDPHLLLAVGRLEAYKRVDRLIEAMAGLPNTFSLVIIGDGSQRSALEQRARTISVAERVTFAGHVPDDQLWQWYGRAQVLLSLSTAEAYGLTLLEALAGGCQVVCSGIPAFRELALRFPDRVTLQTDTRIETIVSAVESASRRPADVGVDVGEFSWDAIVRQLVTLYSRSAHAREPATAPYPEYDELRANADDV
jgi:glycosyltransferase involved in cell wall biosynthesis